VSFFPGGFGYINSNEKQVTKSDRQIFSERYLETKRIAEAFEGMMSPLSIALFESFFRRQAERSIVGNCIEFGVFHGKSASVILRNLGPCDQAFLVDRRDPPTLESLYAISSNFEFVKGRSEDLVKTPYFVEKVGGGVRFSHHDASHTYINVSHEIEFIAPYISEGGLMVLDDFGNPNYMQVVAACFNYLVSGNCPVEILLYSNNKAYLCRREDFGQWEEFLVNDILPQLHGVGHEVYLTRTELHPKYRGFSIAYKTPNHMSDLYGLDLYGDRYYRT